MKYHKYNLFGKNIPENYRFVQKGEMHEGTDIWWISSENVNMRRNYTYYNDTICRVCGQTYPVIDGNIRYGYIRKIS